MGKNTKCTYYKYLRNERGIAHYLTCLSDKNTIALLKIRIANHHLPILPIEVGRYNNTPSFVSVLKMMNKSTLNWVRAEMRGVDFYVVRVRYGLQPCVLFFVVTSSLCPFILCDFWLESYQVKLATIARLLSALHPQSVRRFRLTWLMWPVDLIGLRSFCRLFLPIHSVHKEFCNFRLFRASLSKLGLRVLTSPEVTTWSCACFLCLYLVNILKVLSLFHLNSKHGSVSGKQCHRRQCRFSTLRAEVRNLHGALWYC